MPSLLKKPAVLTALMFALGFALAAARTFDSWPPVPRVHDEFSYLLGADTFRAGRLTNPPHALAPHFETFHVLQSPTYASKYPPAQALLLAFGWTIGGSPIVGVWLGFALMSACLFWALRVWIGVRWAIVGTASVSCWLALTYWANSYWGGALAAAAGALVYGALPRLRERPSIAVSVLLGIGLAVLANTRPLEGLLASLPVAVAVTALAFSKRFPWTTRLSRIVLPLSIVGTMTLAAMGIYNRAVTGSPISMPHLVYEQQKEVVPLFLWQKAQTPSSNLNERERSFQAWAQEYYAEERGPVLALQSAVVKLSRSLDFLLPLALAFPLVLLPQVRRSSPMGYALTGVGLVCLGIAVSTWYQPHYLAPIVAPFAALYFDALKRIQAWEGGFQRFRRDLVIVTIAMWILPATIYLVGHLPPTRWHSVRNDWAMVRARLADSLAQTGHNYVLVVRYPRDYSVHQEWVYNSASVDGQSVVWARSLGAQRDTDVTRYYDGRCFLWVEITNDHQVNYRLSPFESPGAEQSSCAPNSAPRNSTH